MKLSRIFFCALAGIVFRCLAAEGSRRRNRHRHAVVATPPVYVPDYTHANEPLPDGMLAWDICRKRRMPPPTDAQAHFAFNFTNISGGNVVILNVHPSCGCTTAELPPLPWMLAPGTNGQIGVDGQHRRQKRHAFQKNQPSPATRDKKI